jgi:hypothetical protein
MIEMIRKRAGYIPPLRIQPRKGSAATFGFEEIRDLSFELDLVSLLEAQVIGQDPALRVDDEGGRVAFAAQDIVDNVVVLLVVQYVKCEALLFDQTQPLLAVQI